MLDFKFKTAIGCETIMITVHKLVQTKQSSMLTKTDIILTTQNFWIF